MISVKNATLNHCNWDMIYLNSKRLGDSAISLRLYFPNKILAKISEFRVCLKSNLSYDVASGSEITP